jgi:hypothetical protein
MTDYTTYIDTVSGTWGKTSSLAFSDVYSDLSDLTDSELRDHGNTYGTSFEDVLQVVQEDAVSDIVTFDGDLAESVNQLYYAAEAILEALGVDPSEPCKLCDTTFGFHTNECPTHEMNIATDAVAEWVR